MTFIVYPDDTADLLDKCRRDEYHRVSQQIINVINRYGAMPEDLSPWDKPIDRLVSRILSEIISGQ